MNLSESGALYMCNYYTITISTSLRMLAMVSAAALSLQGGN